MKTLFQKTWFQIILFGAIVGIVLIVLDSKFDFLGKKTKNSEEYKGPINMDRDKTYFTKAEYVETEYNFGKVKEGDTVVHVFKLKNTGKEPLIIYKSNGSCECIAAFSSGKNILPDSTGDINVFFKTKGRKGSQRKTVSVVTNTDPSEMILALTGEVE
jgi:hypothetical protein